MDNILVNDITNLAFGLIVLVGVFFLLRKLILWYYRINDIIRLLEQINNSLSSGGISNLTKNESIETKEKPSSGLAEGLDLKTTEELQSILVRYENDKGICHPDYITEVKKELSKRN